MSNSIFTNAYSYRKRENKNNLENYLIELFAFCLNYDLAFRNSFMDLIHVDDIFENITTQFSILGSRPDILINCKNTNIFVECKIEASESPGQLDRYKLELNKTQKLNKVLVYITKYFEIKDCKTVRWIDISSKITDQNSELVIELNKFLIENKIAMETNFDPLDLVVLKNIDSTILKMSESLNEAKKFFDKELFLLQSNSPEVGLRSQKWYGYYKIMNSIVREVNLGFMWHFKDDDNIYCGISFAITKFSHEIDIQHLNDMIKNDWIIHDLGSEVWYTKRSNLSDILKLSNQQTHLISWFTDFIVAFKNLMKIYPKYF